MKTLQHILFPFMYGPESNFVENKWRHTLMKIVLIVFLILVLYKNISISTPEIKPIAHFDIRETVTKVAILADIGITGDMRTYMMQPKRIITGQKMGISFPYLTLEQENMLKIKVQESMPEATPDEIVIKTQEIASMFVPLPPTAQDYIDYYLSFSTSIYEALVTFILFYAVFLGLQLAYFKGIIGIIYRSKGK